MARKNYDRAEMLPGIEEDAVPAPPKPRPRAEAKTKREIPTVRLAVSGLAVAAGVLASLFTFQRLEQFLIGDPRFALNVPGGPADISTLEISGASHASHRQIESVFADDAGRSVYLVPLSDRRAAIRQVDWIRDASVGRLWPNRLVVAVNERKPVAFVTLEASRVGMIDEDGVILPPVADHFSLPVLTGIRSSDPISKRQDRVARVLRLLRDLGEHAAKISEVDITDRDNLRIREPREGRMLTLSLGDRNFSQRYRNFESHYSEITRRLPDATALDLRLEDRITVVE
jgi:cell division protein FtsQ